MSQPMPNGDFKWLSGAECREMEQRLKNGRKRNKVFTQNQSYIFEVELNYSQELHERDDDYAITPELITIKAEITGEKTSRIARSKLWRRLPIYQKTRLFLLAKEALCGARTAAGFQP